MIDIENKVLLFQNQYHYSKINEILFKLNVPYSIIKGEPLSLLAYGKECQRLSNDIDILVSRSSLKHIEMILKRIGYIQRSFSRKSRIMMLSYSHQLLPYFNIKYNLFVDINFDIFWGEYEGRRIDIDEFLSDTIEMDIYGVKVKTLTPIKSMVQLILHQYKEMNSIYHLARHNCINYNMFKDVYYLWKNNQETITLEKFYAISSEYEINPYVFYVLYFTNWIFKDKELQKYVEAFRTLEGESLLDYYGLAEKERKPWKVNFQTRLETDNLYELIQNDLTEEDIEKLERNRRMFG